MSPWKTRTEAADYLRVSVDSVDRLLVEMQPRSVPGKIRFARIEAMRQKSVRLVASDVTALLPTPEEA